MRKVLFVFLAFCLSACATGFEQPRNITDAGTGAYQAQRQPMSVRSEQSALTTTAFQNAGRCNDIDIALAPVPGALLAEPVPDTGSILSPGDMVRVDITRGEGFAGNYVVNADGYIQIPHIGNIPAAGFSTSTLENNIARLLVHGKLFRANFVQVNTSVLHWAPIQVQVGGAVFSGGDTVLNSKQASDDSAERLTAPGDYTAQRTLSAALSAAAGVRPDADIRNIVLIRKGRRRIYDMTGSLDGGPLDDPLLVAGDRVHVPSRGCFQLALARPSRITPPGIRVYMSNLTRPAASNANSAIGRDATSLPYGTRFLQGLVSANCVGGIQATNASRWGVLISRNPINGESEVVARSIEQLVRRADRDDFNPVLLPGDAIACYDSHVTNARDVIATISETASPILSAIVLGGLVK